MSELKHIAFIMDGNGRWATKRGMPREFGHKNGVETYRRVSTYCRDIGIKELTVYALSTENIVKRPKHEIAALMELIKRYLDEAERDCDKNKSAFRVPGDKSGLPKDVVDKMDRVEKITEKYSSNHILNVCVNYGGRADIVNAVNKLIAQGKKEISEEDINKNLTTYSEYPPDLIVRTGGETRISNFLLWDCAYSEFVFLDTLWPDMTEKDVDEAINQFNGRSRRFGAVESK